MKVAPILAIAGAGLALLAIQLLTPRAAPVPLAQVPAAEAVATGAGAGEDGGASELDAGAARGAAGSDAAGESLADDAGAGPTDAPDLETAQQEEIKAGLAYLDSVRAIPGAAPLLDDIVGYLKQDDGSNFSIEGLATDASGLAVVDQSANRQMIKDPEIRAKWEKLMALIAANGEK